MIVLSRLRLVLLNVVTASCALAGASTQGAAQTLAAQAGAETLVRRCVADGGRPRIASGMVRSVRLGNLSAAVLDAARFGCDGAAAPDCGPFGCVARLYLAATKPVFEGPVRAWRVRGDRFEVTRGAAYCPGAVDTCVEFYRLEGDELKRAGGGAGAFTRDPEPRPVASRRLSASRPPQGAAARRRGRPVDGHAVHGGVSAPVEGTRPRFDAPEPTAEAKAKRRRALEAAPYVP